VSFGIPFWALLGRPACVRCGAIKPSVVVRNPTVESDGGKEADCAYVEARPLCDDCAWQLQLALLTGKPRGWRFRSGHHVVVL
jgi:hypothetical protein